jgi:hypothetical protein
MMKVPFYDSKPCDHIFFVPAGETLGVEFHFHAFRLLYLSLSISWWLTAPLAILASGLDLLEDGCSGFLQKWQSGTLD